MTSAQELDIVEEGDHVEEELWKFAREWNQDFLTKIHVKWNQSRFAMNTIQTGEEEDVKEDMKVLVSGHTSCQEKDLNAKISFTTDAGDMVVEAEGINVK